MSEFRANRRDMLIAGAGVGGLLAAGVPALAQAAQGKGAGTPPTTRDLAEKLKVSPANNKALEMLYEPTNSASTVLEKLVKDAKAASESVELAVREVADSRGTVIAYALSATVPTNGVFPLSLNGQPFMVTRFSCSFDRIAWVAGPGWPLYTTRCPRNNFGPGMFFRDAFAHQIVPWVKGVGYGIGCNNPTSYDFGRAGHLHVGVNDDQYGDNQGTFEFTIYNYS